MDAGGRVVHVPNIYTNVFTASTQATQGAEINTQARAAVDVTLTVNTHKYVAWIIGDLDLVQLATKYELNEKYAKEAARVLMQELEDALFALESSFTATAVGSAVAAIDDLSIRQAIAYMDNANFPLTEVAFFVHPTIYWNQLAGLSKFAPNYASNLNLVATGVLGGGDIDQQRVGMLYGRRVFTSPRVATPANIAQNILVHPAAFGFAVTNQVTRDFGGSYGVTGKVRVQMENQLRNLGLLAVCDMIYGVGALRTDAGITILALTTATVA
jgi:hypothetical protein